MKRLLLGPAILSPLALLGFCSFHTPKLPEAPAVLRGAESEVVRQIPLDDFNAFPSVPQVIPVVPVRKPTKPQVKKHGPDHHPVTRRAAPRPPVAPPAPPVEEPPPQQGPICIFPLNMIPNCTPQEVQ